LRQACFRTKSFPVLDPWKYCIPIRPNQLPARTICWRIDPQNFPRRTELRFACYGDRSNIFATTFTGRHPTRGTRSGFEERRRADMNCSGRRGGFRSITVERRRTKGDDEDWNWEWICMNGSSGRVGTNFLRESGQRGELVKACGCFVKAFKTACSRRQDQTTYGRGNNGCSEKRIWPTRGGETVVVVSVPEVSYIPHPARYFVVVPLYDC